MVDCWLRCCDIARYLFHEFTHGLAYPLDGLKKYFRWIFTNLVNLVWDVPQFDPNLNPGFDPNFEFDPITLSHVIVLLLLSWWSLLLLKMMSPYLGPRNRKNILLAGIVNPANFNSKEVYSLFTQWLRYETINQSNLQFFRLLFLLLWSKGGFKAVMGSFHQTKIRWCPILIFTG